MNKCSWALCPRRLYARDGSSGAIIAPWQVCRHPHVSLHFRGLAEERFSSCEPHAETLQASTTLYLMGGTPSHVVLQAQWTCYSKVTPNLLVREMWHNNTPLRASGSKRAKVFVLCATACVYDIPHHSNEMPQVAKSTWSPSPPAHMPRRR